MSYIIFGACYENTSGYVTCYKTLGTCYVPLSRVLVVTWELPDMDRSSPCRQNVEELSLPSWSRKPRLGHDDS